MIDNGALRRKSSHSKRKTRKTPKRPKKKSVIDKTRKQKIVRVARKKKFIDEVKTVHYELQYTLESSYPAEYGWNDNDYYRFDLYCKASGMYPNTKAKWAYNFDMYGYPHE